MNKQQLAAKIWESANQMRSKIEANDYKDYILGFIFYKFLSDKQIQFLIQNEFDEQSIKELNEGDTDTLKYIQDELGYFIAYDNLFSTWISDGKDFDIAYVRDALSAFSRLINPDHKDLFDGIFTTLETGLSKLGESAAAQTKAAMNLIHLIDGIPMKDKHDYDVLGFIYEYLISSFAANAGKKAGEFYTPHEVSVLMSEIMAEHLKNHKHIKIYDPTSGSGSLLINIGQSVERRLDGENNIRYYAQELKQNTYNLTRMNLFMRGILPNNIITRNADTLEDDWPLDEDKTHEPMRVDAVVSNPPYSQKWDPEFKDKDPRYSPFGLAPKTKADYAFLLHDLYHLKPDGIMTIVLPHGVLFRGGDEGKIRENLIEKNHIDAIIGLPANIFFGTGIPTIILVLKQTRNNDDVLIIDASKGFVKEGKNNKLRACDIKRIVDAVVTRKPQEKFAALVSRDTIRDNGYNLNIPRYVDSSDAAESWDIYASMFGGIPNNELDALKHYWQSMPNLKASLFKLTSSNYSALKVADVRAEIEADCDVQQFMATYQKAFSDFEAYLTKSLIKELLQVKPSRQQDIISEEIFRRLEGIALIDKYDAYQLLDDQWQQLSADLEMIQTEGMNTCKVVEPNMVTKKQKGKDVQVQDGWFGRIFPFALVEKTYFAKDLAKIQVMAERLQSIESKVQEIFDSLSEDDKEAECVNDDKTAFVTAALNKEVKQIKADKKKGETFDDDSFESKLLAVDKLQTEEKSLKTNLKAANEALLEAARKKIENLTQDEIDHLLLLKWIKPIVSSLDKLPNQVLQQLTSKLETLAEKYAQTYADIAQKTQQVERSLAAMMGELQGSDFDMRGLKELQQFLSGEKSQGGADE
ncbi:type I restriction-modification system subunit M [Xenorhabdus sp. XENO-7]|uniref:site-specific DNA-methyltransferase (adenine-specific) n=1 Tax=Xenorhabdus aichiensis TaxID=3025874 RepID=A0ABT5M615_9GAMM|nr:type I restriction-modification system subunit M [Xenorhabdus aichiensis]MDC9623152.1 type I restriction-modification system subunit M [Xenorhabdus aichiensis]